MKPKPFSLASLLSERDNLLKRLKKERFKVRRLEAVQRKKAKMLVTPINH